MFIPLSDAEKERIEKQGWTQADGVDVSKLIVAGLNQYRLSHKADGACVFLDEKSAAAFTPSLEKQPSRWHAACFRCSCFPPEKKSSLDCDLAVLP